MNRARVAVFIVVAPVFIVVTWAVLANRAGRIECDLVVSFLRLLGADGVSSGGAGRMNVDPAHGRPFQVIVTTACSGLPSLLTLLCLGAVASRSRRRIAAIAAGAAVAVVGNLIRITASVGLGAVAGRSALVAFHDWAGSAMTIAYTVGGFMLLVRVALPRSAT